MKKTLFTMLLLVAGVCINSSAFAAELLDVKPIISDTGIAIEISADIAMTYTYYKVPGQARAVVDIAEADPEKVEPLIVVNKGAIASISVDKAELSGLVVSRIIFNLVSETDIQVNAASDRRKLTVTFGGGSASVSQSASKPEAITDPALKSDSAITPEPVDAAVAVNAPTAVPAAVTAPDEDPLGLDEPAAKAGIVSIPAIAAGASVSVAPPTVIRIPKLEPVVPTVAQSPRPGLAIKEVVTGASYIEIKTNQAVSDYKSIKLKAPDRLAIDIACDTANQKPTNVAINKFGIAKIRVGVYPKYIRVVLDSEETGFPTHTIEKVPDGLRISFF